MEHGRRDATTVRHRQVIQRRSTYGHWRRCHHRHRPVVGQCHHANGAGRRRHIRGGNLATQVRPIDSRVTGDASSTSEEQPGIPIAFRRQLLRPSPASPLVSQRRKALGAQQLCQIVGAMLSDGLLYQGLAHGAASFRSI